VTVKGEAMLGPPSGDVLNPVATLLSLSGGKGAGTGRTTRSIFREKGDSTNTWADSGRGRPGAAATMSASDGTNDSDSAATPTALAVETSTAYVVCSAGTAWLDAMPVYSRAGSTYLWPMGCGGSAG